MKRVLLIPLLLFNVYLVRAQINADTSQLDEVVLKAYFTDQPLLRATGSVSVIGSPELRRQAPFSLLPAVNTASGVRMEERSPGSYRLSIRGSLLRSPFGIRNVKVYLDDFILTDAGGNSYLNLFDASFVGRMEILKGPEGSIFGASSGGVVLIHSPGQQSDSSRLSASFSGGSYGLMYQNLSYHNRIGRLELGLNQAYQRSDGYRENSGLSRKSLQLTPKWSYSARAAINMLVLYSDLKYQTPGGLTLAQMQANPRSARPSTAFAPGAAEQRAGVENETVLAGISHAMQLAPRLRHVVSVTTSATNFTNPFITTYEVRKEKSAGLRTYLEYRSRQQSQSWNWQYGLETQTTASEKRNYVNNLGAPDQAQDFVDFSATQSFLFARFAWQPGQRLSTEAALSLNFYQYQFQGIYPEVTDRQIRNFKSQLMPRLALSYALSDVLSLRASASKGYSAPTLEEVRPSNRIVNTDLEPEIGWNYEAGFRLIAGNGRVYADAVAYQYRLNRAIVRRVDAADAEYFTNAGKTDQRGVELQLKTWVLPLKASGFLRGFRLNESYSLSDFKFDEYSINALSFAGNRLAGVPRHNLVTALDLYFPFRLNLYLQHNFVSAIPLNDENAAFADKYHLMQAKINWNGTVANKLIQLFAGADNLLNVSYSLGNDLNAFGSRFFNPSPNRNYYAGLGIRF
jgi:iron complex outermembrane recepter protein